MARPSSIIYKSPKGQITIEDVKLMVEKYFTHPEAFALEVLQFQKDKGLDKFQYEMLERIVNNKRTAVASGRGIGKTVIMSIVALWWLCTHPGAQVMLVSNNYTQVITQMFTYMRQYAERSIIPHWFECIESKISLAGSPTAAIRPYSTPQDPTKLRGKHAQSMLILVDEAQGLNDELFDVLIGNTTDPGAKILLIGNPCLLNVPFHKCFTEWSEDWSTMHVDARDCKFIDPEEIATYIKNNGGLESDRVRVNVLGQFPRQSISAYISGEDLKACRELSLERSAYEEIPVVIGLDLAYGGADEAVLVVRQGRKIHRIERYRPDDMRVLRERAATLFNQFRAAKIIVDISGGGKSFTDELKPYLPRNSVVDVMFGSKSLIGHGESELHRNNRQKIWSLMRAKMADGSLDLSSLTPKDYADLHAELSVVGVEIDSAGREVIEPKSEIKKRLGRSPDISDALALALSMDPRADSSLSTGITTSNGSMTHSQYVPPKGGWQGI